MFSTIAHRAADRHAILLGVKNVAPCCSVTVFQCGVVLAGSSEVKSCPTAQSPAQNPGLQEIASRPEYVRGSAGCVSFQVLGRSKIAGGRVHAFLTAPNRPIDPVTDDLGLIEVIGGEPRASDGTDPSRIRLDDVTSVNDAPAGADKTVSVLEDGTYTFSAADFGFTDTADAAGTAGANALANVKITTLPGAGNLTLSGKLRGLSPNHALVLVNGKRRHGGSSLAISAGPFQGGAAADLNFIPVAYIDHIEVLQDGDGVVGEFLRHVIES